MSFGIGELLARGRAAPGDVSALDAVMGADWAVVGFDRARKDRQPRLALAGAHRRDVARYGGDGGSSIPPGGKPQAMVKLIRGGGTANAAAMQRQMDYLSRDGTQTLERSERYMGAEIGQEDTEALPQAWRMPDDSGARADRTSHLLVSFPNGTDEGAAYRAGRAWADDMFGSGTFGGDSYDYYTAFHTDRAHPHMHVIVNRRGLDNGEWLKVSLRSDINYDSMRARLVDVAAREGIALEASTRFARGQHDRPVPDAAYRRAVAQERAAAPPEHTRDSSIRAAAAMIYYARRFAEDAERVERENPDQAALLRCAADAVAHGRDVAAEISDHRGSGQEREMASTRIEETRLEVQEKFAGMDRGLDEIDNPAQHARLARQVAAMKAEAAPFMRDADTLRDFTARDDSGRYQGIGALRESAPEVAARYDRRVEDIARRYGADPEATLERHSGDVPSKALADQFAAAETREIEQSLANRGVAPERVGAVASQDLEQMHREIRSTYQLARERIEREVPQAPARPAEHAAQPPELSEKAQAYLAQLEEERVRMRKAREESRARGDDDRPRDDDRAR